MIRPATAQDSPQIAAIYRPFCEESCVSFETTAPDAAEMASRIERISAQYPWLVLDLGDGTVAGYAYASRHRERAAYRWSVEVTVYVADGQRGKCVGRALYGELFGRLRSQGFFKAYAGILVPNPASQAFHESLGFSLVGIYRGVGYKLGAWRDVGWWQLALQPEIVSPRDPAAPTTSPTQLQTP
jgi:phosphinothricin acetyltransferase